MTAWVLLRGWARERGHWGSFPQVLGEQLGPAHDVLMLDLPGNGRLHAAQSPATVAGMVHACRRQLAARDPHAPCVVLGLSLGAMVALQWSHAFPGEVAAAVLVNGSFGGHAPPWQRLRPRAWSRLLGMLAPGMTPDEREARVIELTSRRFRGDAALAARWAAIAREHPVSAPNVLRQLLAAARFRAAMQAPAVPLLMATSQGDALVSHLCTLAAAARWGAPVIAHDSAGHDLPLDEPEWLARHAAAWWRGLESRGSAIGAGN